MCDQESENNPQDNVPSPTPPLTRSISPSGVDTVACYCRVENEVSLQHLPETDAGDETTRNETARNETALKGPCLCRPFHWLDLKENRENQDTLSK